MDFSETANSRKSTKSAGEDGAAERKASSMKIYNPGLYEALVASDAHNYASSRNASEVGAGSRGSLASGLDQSGANLGMSSGLGSLQRYGSAHSTAGNGWSPSTPIEKSQDKVWNPKQSNKQKRHQEYWLQQEKLQKESIRKVKERIEKQAVEKEESFNGMWQKLMEGHDICNEIEHRLELQEQADLRRQKEKHKLWTENVFNAIQDNIVDKVNAQDYDALAKKRREAYQKYLDVSNTKGLFRDIIIEGDYDPLEQNRNTIKAKVSKLNDPVKRVLAKGEEEQKLAAQGNTAAQGIHASSNIDKTGGRDTLDVLMWGQGKIDSTPHGHMSKMMDTKGSNARSKTTASSIVFDHYNVEAPPPVKRALDIFQSSN